MLGAGHSEVKRRLIAVSSVPEDETKWLTLDDNKSASPDEVFDLDRLEKGFTLPWANGFFDEIHAYEILEHFGRQGDFRGFFSTFRAFHLALKPRGLLLGTCPSVKSEWAWGDPGHTRVITAGTLGFLTFNHYDQLGRTASSDYRKFVEPYWWVMEQAEDDGKNLAFALRKSD
jgi:hypothetical protein